MRRRRQFGFLEQQLQILTLGGATLLTYTIGGLLWLVPDSGEPGFFAISLIFFTGWLVTLFLGLLKSSDTRRMSIAYMLLATPLCFAAPTLLTFVPAIALVCPLTGKRASQMEFEQFGLSVQKVGFWAGLK